MRVREWLEELGVGLNLLVCTWEFNAAVKTKFI